MNSGQFIQSGKSFLVKVMLKIMWSRNGVLCRGDTIIKGTVVRNNRICGKKKQRSLVFLEQGEMKVER